MTLDWVKDKMSKTNLERYGAKNPFGSPLIQQKILATLQSRYKVSHPSHIEGTGEKSKRTLHENFGSTGLRHPSILEKKIATSRARHGVDFPMQDGDIQRRSFKGQYRLKTHRVGGHRFEGLMGYEPQAIDALLNLGVSPDLIASGSGVGSFEYSNGNRRYFPDLLLRRRRNSPTLTYVEVKSLYTLSKSVYNLAEKIDSVLYHGHELLLLVLDQSGEVLYKKFFRPLI
jgi:hypothetical protein